MFTGSMRGNRLFLRPLLFVFAHAHGNSNAADAKINQQSLTDNSANLVA